MRLLHLWVRRLISNALPAAFYWLSVRDFVCPPPPLRDSCHLFLDTQCLLSLPSALPDGPPPREPPSQSSPYSGLEIKGSSPMTLVPNEVCLL